GGEPLSQWIAAGRAPRVDRATEFPVLRCLDVQAPVTLDDLAVDGDDPGGLTNLRDGEGGQFAPPQAAVCGDIGHQFIALPQRPVTQGLAEPGEVVLGWNLGGGE